MDKAPIINLHEDSLESFEGISNHSMENHVACHYEDFKQPLLQHSADIQEKDNADAHSEILIAKEEKSYESHQEESYEPHCLQLSEIASILSIPNQDDRIHALREAKNHLEALHQQLFTAAMKSDTVTEQIEELNEIVDFSNKLISHIFWEKSGGKEGAPWPQEAYEEQEGSMEAAPNITQLEEQTYSPMPTLNAPMQVQEAEQEASIKDEPSSSLGNVIPILMEVNPSMHDSISNAISEDLSDEEIDEEIIVESPCMFEHENATSLVSNKTLNQHVSNEQVESSMPSLSFNVEHEYDEEFTSFTSLYSSPSCSCEGDVSCINCLTIDGLLPTSYAITSSSNSRSGYISLVSLDNGLEEGISFECAAMENIKGDEKHAGIKEKGARTKEAVGNTYTTALNPSTLTLFDQSSSDSTVQNTDVEFCRSCEAKDDSGCVDCEGKLATSLSNYQEKGNSKLPRDAEATEGVDNIAITDIELSDSAFSCDLYAVFVKEVENAVVIESHVHVDATQLLKPHRANFENPSCLLDSTNYINGFLHPILSCDLPPDIGILGLDYSSCIPCLPYSLHDAYPFALDQLDTSNKNTQTMLLTVAYAHGSYHTILSCDLPPDVDLLEHQHITYSSLCEISNASKYIVDFIGCSSKSNLASLLKEPYTVEPLVIEPESLPKEIGAQSILSTHMIVIRDATFSFKSLKRFKHYGCPFPSLNSSCVT